MAGNPHRQKCSIATPLEKADKNSLASESKKTTAKQRKHRLASTAKAMSSTQRTQTLGGLLPYKSDEGARQKISRTLLKGTRILYYGHVPNSFPSLRGTNSTTTNYITGTAFLLKDFWKVLNVINLTETTLAAVILGFSTLSGTNPQI